MPLQQPSPTIAPELDPALLDNPRRRLGRSILASILLNALIWSIVAAAALRHHSVMPPPVEVTRVILDAKGHKTEKVVTPKQIQQRVAQLHPQVVKMQPTPPPEVVPRQQPITPPRQEQAPPQSHSLIASRVPDKTSNEPPVQTEGQAQPGKPADNQNEAPVATTVPAPPSAPAQQPPPQTGGGTTNGNGQAETPAPVVPTPIPSPPPTPTPLPTPTPQPTPTPVPQPTATPRPLGPTQEAEPVSQENPDIPSDLRDKPFKTSVRVAVDVDANGGSSPRLRTSSGNSEVDARVLAALKRWRWKPALKDGQPVASTKYFKFEFTVE